MCSVAHAGHWSCAPLAHCRDMHFMFQPKADPSRQLTLSRHKTFTTPTPCGKTNLCHDTRWAVFFVHTGAPVAHTTPFLSRHHLQSRDPKLEMGSSPPHLVPRTFSLYCTYCKTNRKLPYFAIKATGTWKTLQNVFIIQKGV